VPCSELDERRVVVLQAHEFAARSAAGRPVKRTNGSASAVIRGTRSTPEASALPASTTELRPRATVKRLGWFLLRSGFDGEFVDVWIAGQISLEWIFQFQHRIRLFLLKYAERLLE
jgi:hypothetical protein